jgi:signal transduction histidine kinase
MATGDFHLIAPDYSVLRIVVPATSNLEADMQTADPTRVQSLLPENDPLIGVLPDEIIVLAERGGVAVGPVRAGGASVRSARHGLRHGGMARTRSIEIPLIGGNGEISGVLCRDIPIVQRSNRPMHSARPHSLSRDEIAKVFVHDINNLLSVIGGGLNLLERPCDAAAQDAIFARMRKAIARGAKLSRSLLDADRNPSPVINDTTSRADVIAVAGTLGQAFSLMIDVEFKISADLWDFNADPEKLYFALLNLCRNADAAMQHSGVVSITATNLDPTPATPQGAVLITVADNGAGMSQEVLSRAFEPYYTTKAAGHGSGLGLAQVRDFVEDNGGAIRLESEAGVGTMVHMIFPRVLSGSPIVSIDPYADPRHGHREISFVAGLNGGTFLLTNVGDDTP